ncbi:hypothetical protein [Oceanobacillus kapialis]|uniref:hypothetical protein n=1 Tax=Oceanobacillus kapialis TaxID=481353 RepID=UPI0038511886
MSKKNDYGLTREELRREEEERIQDSNDEYWLTPINEDKTLAELEDDFYYKQVKAEQAYLDGKLEEQLEFEDVEIDFEEDAESIFVDEELEIDEEDLEFLNEKDDTGKKAKEYAKGVEDKEFEI